MQPRISGTLNATLANTALALAALCAASPASAQMAGTYVGTTSQGKTIEVTIKDDGAGGFLFGGALVFWDATCAVSGEGRDVGWGIGGDVPLTTPSFSYEFNSNQLYESYKFKFINGSMDIKGSFLGRTSEFVDINTSNKKVQLCDSSKLTFDATFTPTPPAAAGKPALPAAGQAVQVR